MGARQKLILLSGYVWSESPALFCSKKVLAAYGLVETSAHDDVSPEPLLATDRVAWFSVEQGKLTAHAAIRGQQLAKCRPRVIASAVVNACDRDLGGPPVVRGHDVPSTLPYVEPGASDARREIRSPLYARSSPTQSRTFRTWN